jgi:hypothetical protein
MNDTFGRTRTDASVLRAPGRFRRGVLQSYSGQLLYADKSNGTDAA